MVEDRGLKDQDVKKPQPEPVKVDGGTSSAVHELDLEGEAEQVPKEAEKPSHEKGKSITKK